MRTGAKSKKSSSIRLAGGTSSKVSIALCTFNGERFLEEQLQSYVYQSRVPDQLIVCDDCSTDRTLSIIENFRNQAPFPVEVFRNETNLGVVRNFEKAINLCSGDFIFLSDQDDIWNEEKVSSQLKLLCAPKQPGLVFSDVEFIKSDASSYGISLFELLNFDASRQRNASRGGAFAEILRLCPTLGCAMAFRSELRQVACPIPTDIPNVIHDYWLGLVISAVSDVDVTPQKLIQYRQHPTQQTGYKAMLHSNDSKPKPDVRTTVADFDQTISNLKDRNALAQIVQSAILERSGTKSALIEYEINKFTANIRHLESRTSIQSSAPLASKLHFLFEEAKSLRYHKYSNGSRSIIRDLYFLFSKQE